MRLEGGQIKLTDLCDANGKVLDLYAEGVTFTGPAVMVPDGCTLNECTWDAGGGGAEAVVWEIDPARPAVVGAVHAVNCNFQRCQFTNVGFAGTTEMVNDFFGNSSV
jgi:hypothetical protein